MEQIKIVGWTSYDSEYPSIDLRSVDSNEIQTQIIKEIINNNLLFSGEDHQNHPYGCPLFNNGTVFRASMRVWAFLMAIAHNDMKDNIPNYMNYYMQCENSVFPSLTDNNVEINKEELNNGALPSLCQQDVDIIMETIKCGITEFITTDKALKLLFPLYQKRYNDRKKYKVKFESNEEEVTIDDNKQILRRVGIVNYENDNYYIFLDDEKKVAYTLKQIDSGIFEEVDDKINKNIVHIFFEEFQKINNNNNKQ